ncbi:MAG: DUF3617 family protein [Erythrobacter sp.]|nr:MAG: DUF3617 family protein [Erythrobacter sp.]
MALVLPVLPLSGQDPGPAVQIDPRVTDESFPWPDFIEATPVPGRYRLTAIVENFGLAGLEVGKEVPPMDETTQAPDISYICLAGDVERVDWLAELRSEGECTSDGPTGDDENFRIAVQCVEPGGSRNEIVLTGSASDQGMEMQMAMTMRAPEMGKMTMDMRMTVERVGDCE